MNEIEQQKNEKRRVIRIFFVLGIFVTLFVAVAWRLVLYQIIDSKKYKELARTQYEKKFTLPAMRGNIYDRDGNILVSSTRLVSFAADPWIIGDRARSVAAAFSKVFQKPAAVYLEKLQRDPEKRFVWLERHVLPSVARRMEKEKPEGIVVMNESKRLYHYDEVASTLVGYTNIDTRGIAGLEFQYDNVLRGVDGSVVMQRDGLGRVRPSADYPQRDPINGNNLILTINLTYQAIVDEELKRGVEEQQADGGLAVMLNPTTGEILALSAYPRGNPNEIGKIDIALLRNRVVSDIFEPGSVFKVVTAAAAYEHGIVTPSDRFYAERGKMKIIFNAKESRTITDSHPHEWLTFQEAIEQSSNIVCAKVSRLIGGERFYRMARDFGFGMVTGVDLPGEARGILKKPSEWSAATLQSLSYGYEVGVTPLQLACAYAAVANNGVLMKPYVVAAIRSPKGDIVTIQQPTPVRRLLSPRTVELLRQALEGVVEKGTAKPVMMKSMRIAGKTGTSRRWVDGKYVENSYTASFIGFFPAENPQVVCLVMLDNPKKQYYGGITSGPVFRSIAERVMSTSYKFSTTVLASASAGEEDRIVPDVRMLTLPIAQKLIKSYDLLSTVYGSGTLVVRQSPEPGKKIQKGDAVTLVLEDATQSPRGYVRVPNVCGMSIRRALNRLVIDDFDIKVEGSGKVVSQTPAAGELVKAGTRVFLQCQATPFLQTVAQTSGGKE